MASPTRWTWVWVGSRSRWWTGKCGVLQSMGSQRVRHDWATELNWTEERKKPCLVKVIFIIAVVVVVLCLSYLNICRSLSLKQFCKKSPDVVFFSSKFLERVWLIYPTQLSLSLSQGASGKKKKNNLPTNAGDMRDMDETLGGKDPLEEGMATHSIILAWRIPRTEEPGGPQSIGLHRVRHN